MSKRKEVINIIAYVAKQKLQRTKYIYIYTVFFPYICFLNLQIYSGPEHTEQEIPIMVIYLPSHGQVRIYPTVENMDKNDPSFSILF